MAAPFRLMFLAGFIAILVIGIMDIVFNFESNSCEMTYMYEYPEYLEVPLPSKIKEKFPRYGLYFYGEGRYASESSNFRLKGIPVLFIPGNAGSHKQVRSLGSVALRKAISMKTDFHFNYFAVDLDEELAGLFGGVLWDQTEFVHQCIRHILTLYKSSSHPPKSVLIVGHSMGGIVARALYSLQDFDPKLVHTIITQSTPHQVPVVRTDSYLAEFYETVNAYWRKHVNTTLKDVTVFSVGGGFRDIQVRTGITSVIGIVPPSRSISALVQADGAGNQEGMFDIVDRNTKQIAVSPIYRVRAFFHHFVHNPGSKTYKGVYIQTTELDPNIKWEYRRKKSWSFNRDKMSITRYSVVQLPKDEKYGFVAISSTTHEHWIAGCKLSKPDEKCTQATNLSPHGNLFPPMYSWNKLVHLQPDELDKLSHVIVLLSKSARRLDVTAELYNVSARSVIYEPPNFLSHLANFPRGLVSSDEKVIINRTAPDAVFYNISLKGLDAVLHAYTASLYTLSCQKSSQAGGFAGSVMKLVVPWSGEHTYKFIRVGDSGNTSLKLQSAKPAGYPGNAELHLYLSPSCTYRLTIQTSWREVFGQYMRFYGTMLPAFMVAQVLMALSWQLKKLDTDGVAPSFQESHAAWAQPWRVVPVALFLRFSFSGPELQNLLSYIGIPPDDSVSLIKQGVWFTALPVTLYLMAYAAITYYSYMVHFTIAVFSRTVALMVSRCCRTSSLANAATAMEYLIYLTALFISGIKCGTLGIACVYSVCIIKVVYNYIKARSTEGLVSQQAKNKFNVYLSLLLLLMCLLLLNGPSLVVWIKGLKHSQFLTADPSRVTAIITVLSFLFLAAADFPSMYSVFFETGSWTVYFTCVLLVIFAMESIYRTSYLVCGTLLIVSVPVLLTRWSQGVKAKEKSS